MDILNDVLHAYPPNPLNSDLTESEISDHEEILKNINERKKRKKRITFDDWSTAYSDELWYLWCIVGDFRKDNSILDRLDYPTFCSICFENSSR